MEWDICKVPEAALTAPVQFVGKNIKKWNIYHNKNSI